MYVTFQGQNVATKLAELRQNSTAGELLEVIWPSAAKLARDSDAVIHHGLILLSGRRTKLPPDVKLSEILYETEAALEADFLPFHVVKGRLSKFEKSEPDPDAPQVPAQFRNVRPKTPERKKKSVEVKQTTKS